MKVIVIGAGIAGLAAAWRLRERGAEVVLIERDGEVGGRCRTHFWQDAWRIRGAFAFVGTEQNLIDQARALGIYNKEAVVDLTSAHEQYLLFKRTEVVRQRSFGPADILKSGVLTIGEKAKLAKILPALAAQIGRNDPRDLTSAAHLDTESAYDFMSRRSPNFADYILEPTMQMFCGYEKDDYSIAWLMWLMAGFAWSGHWWSFKERGVGLLTHAMGQRLEVDAGCEVLLDTKALQITAGDGVRVVATQGDRRQEISGDALVFAIPAPLIPDIMPSLDETRLEFLRSVGYVGHHIVHYLFETTAKALPSSLLLPTKDGFDRLSNLHFWPRGDSVFLASGEVKGGYCRKTYGWKDDDILDGVWEDYLAAAPALGDVKFVDRHLQRNDLAICRREAGFVRRLAAFRALPAHRRIAFAGDYMINSTVGQAHWSGLEAAESVLTQQAGRDT